MEYYVETLKHQTITINAHNLSYLPHLHGEAEIITVASGEVSLTVNGVKYVLQPGDCALIQPNMIHAYESAHSRCLLTIFPPETAPSLRTALHGTLYACPVWRGVSEEYLHAVRALLAMNAERDDPVLIKGYLYVLLSLLLRHLTPAAHPPAEFDGFPQVLKYVHAHYDSDLTIRQTAKHFGVTYEHLSRVYKERTGLTFSQHVRLLRISKAKQLLRETTMTIFRIALECGYRSDRTFYRAFVETARMTPGEFRRGKGGSGFIL